MGKNIILLLTCLHVCFIDAYPYDRIFGGQPASISSFPYQVSIRSFSNRHFCGGSIIGSGWVLTAAHCFIGYMPNNVFVIAGTNALNSGGIRYSVSELILHSEYDAQNLNDIALLRISGSIAFSADVQPIQISSQYPPTGANLTLTGWGLVDSSSGNLPNVLQYIHLTSIDIDQCKSILIGLPVTSKHVCTVESVGKGACKADSGGPLVYKGIQVGIVSWGIPCGKGYPDIFTSVSSYLSWIVSKTRS